MIYLHSFSIQMTLSYGRALWQGAAAQSFARRLAVANLMGSVSGWQKCCKSSSSAFSKSNTTTPQFITLRVTLIANIPTSALFAPDVPVSVSSSFSILAIAIPILASIEELFKLFMQTYMDTVKNHAQAQV